MNQLAMSVSRAMQSPTHDFKSLPYKTRVSKMRIVPHRMPGNRVHSSDIVHRIGPNGSDKPSTTSRTGLPFQKRLQLSSDVNVRLSIRSM
jgi:hypothetical protein